jgi:ferritin
MAINKMKGVFTMLSKKMEEALNTQVNREMYSAYLYMAMSAQYIQRKGGSNKLLTIEEPPARWESALDMFEATYEHEQKVTAWINELMEIAIEEKDHATQIFLQWYVTEQVEEEENDTDIIAQLKFIKDDTRGLILLNRELALRVTTVLTDFSKGIEGNIGTGA